MLEKESENSKSELILNKGARSYISFNNLNFALLSVNVFFRLSKVK